MTETSLTMENTCSCPEVLYHYTSLDALFSIVDGIDKDKFILRATHVSFLNDLTEGGLLPKVLEMSGVKKSMLDILQSCSGYSFILSLSELEDNLNMWGRYADNDKGVALGMDYKALNNEFHDELKKCTYTTVDELSKKLKPKCKDIIRRWKDKDDVLPLAKLLSVACYYKDNSFEAESEWRVVKEIVPDGYRCNGTVLVPYISLKIPVPALRSITFGPKSDFEKNRFSLFRMLKDKLSCEYLKKIDIKHSKVPLA